MTINVIQHDDRLRYLQPFYNGAFSIMPKHHFDDQFFLLATVYLLQSSANLPRNSFKHKRGE
jgi:hypothetical protein